MAVKRYVVPAVVASDGTGTFYSPYISGSVEAVQYVKTDYADGVDFTITAETSTETIWTESNVNAAVIKHPRAATHSTLGAAALYAGGGTAVNGKVYLGRDRVKIVIAQGGTSTTGTFHITVSDV